MQKMRPARHKPDPDAPLREFERETGGIKPVPDRKEGWLGNPPWLKKDQQEENE